MYIYSIVTKCAIFTLYPMAILWVFYGYPMVTARKRLLFRSTIAAAKVVIIFDICKF